MAQNIPTSPELLQHLARWYAASARDLPWREAANARDPYRVLVSEIMLQQTTAATVTPRYRAFLEKFPTLKVLSSAPPDDVLAAWQGLGYYNRARNLQAAAQYIQTHYNGIFPRDFDKVLSLPGVGRYTAGAVCSLAFGMPIAAVDVNVARVLARIFVVQENIKSTFAQERVWNLATQLVQEADVHHISPATHNSALIELGARICTKRNPACDLCPLQKFCGAFAKGLQNELPRTPPKRQFVERHDVCLFITRTENNHMKVLLQQCQNSTDKKNKSGNWWHGMWQLPRGIVPPNHDAKDAARLLLQGELGIAGDVKKHIKTVRHTVTHHKIQLDCFSVSIPQIFDFSACDNTLKSTFGWHTREEIEKLALPSAMRKLVDELLPRDEGLLRLMR